MDNAKLRENDSLNEYIVTAMEAMRLFVESARTVLPNGDIIIKIGTKHGEKFEQEEMWRLNNAKMALERIPELANLLEIRVLEMQQADAHKRLSKIRS